MQSRPQPRLLCLLRTIAICKIHFFLPFPTSSLMLNVFSGYVSEVDFYLFFPVAFESHMIYSWFFFFLSFSNFYLSLSYLQTPFNVVLCVSRKNEKVWSVSSLPRRLYLFTENWGIHIFERKVLAKFWRRRIWIWMKFSWECEKVESYKREGWGEKSQIDVTCVDIFRVLYNCLPILMNT